jgi:hypothetical protein
MAVRYGHLEMTKLLALKYNCSITTADSKGLTPLLATIIYEQDEMRDFLTDLLLFPRAEVNYRAATVHYE